MSAPVVPFTAIDWTGEAVRLLDQRRLPEEEIWLELTAVTEVVDAIRGMVVRGAPAIGITAAYGATLAARARYTDDPAAWRSRWGADLDLLGAARPTAVNLAWALAGMRLVADRQTGDPVPALAAAAVRIHEEDIAGNHAMGRCGAAFIQPGSTLLTHCNTGTLATGGFGTALGVVRQAWAENRLAAVYVSETRPWLQGARLTAWELARDNIPATLIVDSASAALMSRRGVDWVIVGADRVAANGDVANKIGTCMHAINARHHGTKFMVVAPTSTIDTGAENGDAIPIEDRLGEEVCSAGDCRIAAVGVDAWNPVFDITPAGLIDVLVTERGAVEKPDRDKIAALFR